MSIQEQLRDLAERTDWNCSDDPPPGNAEAMRAAADRIDVLETTLRTISQMPPALPGINPDGTVSTSPMFMTLARDALREEP